MKEFLFYDAKTGDEEIPNFIYFFCRFLFFASKRLSGWVVLAIQRHFKEETQERRRSGNLNLSISENRKVDVFVTISRSHHRSQCRYLHKHSFPSTFLSYVRLWFFLWIVFCVELRTMHFTGWSFEPIKNARRRPRGLNSMGFTRQITIRHKIRFSVVSLLFFFLFSGVLWLGSYLKASHLKKLKKKYTHFSVCSTLFLVSLFSCLCWAEI